MSASSSVEHGQIPPVGPLSSGQTALLLRVSSLLVLGGLTVVVGLLLATVLLDGPHLFDYAFWVGVLWVQPFSAIVTYVDSKLPDDATWGWAFVLRGRRTER